MKIRYIFTPITPDGEELEQVVIVQPTGAEFAIELQNNYHLDVWADTTAGEPAAQAKPRPRWLPRKQPTEANIHYILTTVSPDGEPLEKVVGICPDGGEFAIELPGGYRLDIRATATTDDLTAEEYADLCARVEIVEVEL